MKDLIRTLDPNASLNEGKWSEIPNPNQCMKKVIRLNGIYQYDEWKGKIAPFSNFSFIFPSKGIRKIDLRGTDFTGVNFAGATIINKDGTCACDFSGSTISRTTENRDLLGLFEGIIWVQD